MNPGSIDPDNLDEPSSFIPHALVPSTSALPLVDEGEEAGPPAKRQKLDESAVQVEAAPLAVDESINPGLLPPEGFAYDNVSVLRGNAMKFLPNFFERGQVSTFSLDLDRLGAHN